MPALKRGLSKVVLSVPTDCLDERPIGVGKLPREERHLVQEYMRAKRENAHLVALQHQAEHAPEIRASLAACVAYLAGIKEPPFREQQQARSEAMWRGVQ